MSTAVKENTYELMKQNRAEKTRDRTELENNESFANKIEEACLIKAQRAERISRDFTKNFNPKWLRHHHYNHTLRLMK